MPFSPNKDKAQTATATATKNKAQSAPAKAAKAKAAAAKGGSSKAKKIALTTMLTNLCATLANTAVTEPKDLLLGNLRKTHTELAEGLAAIATHLGFQVTDETVALRFVPQTVSDKGVVKEPAVYCFAIVSDGDGSCSLRWVNTLVKMSADDEVAPLGLRLSANKSVISIPSHTCNIFARPSEDLPKDDHGLIQTADTFGELSGYIAQGGGGQIKDDYGDGFIFRVDNLEERKSKKGSMYSVLNGMELDDDGLPLAEATIFCVGSPDYWSDYEPGSYILEYKKDKKQFAVYNTNSMDDDGNLEQIDTLDTGGAKLKDLEIGSKWEMYGLTLTESKDYGDGWAIKIVDEDGNTNNVFANTSLTRFIDGNLERIATVAGLEATDENPYPTKKFNNLEQPFASMEILSHEKYGADKVKVNVVCAMHLGEEAKDEQAMLLEQLGIA